MRMKEKTRKTKSSFLQLKLEPIDLLMKAKKNWSLTNKHYSFKFLIIFSSWRKRCEQHLNVVDSLFFQVDEKDANNI